MPILVTERANAILDYMLGTPGYLPATIYIGLLYGAPNVDGSGASEPIGKNYARVVVANNATVWPAATNRVKTHTVNIEFPSASDDWGELAYGGIFTGVSGANLKIFMPLTKKRTVLKNDIYRFMANTSPLRLTV